MRTVTPESLPASRRRRVWISWAAICVLIVGAAAAVKYGRHHVFAKNFAVVEPGRLYRAGYCRPGPLADVLHEHRIRTILTLLNDEPQSREQQDEERVAREAGVTIIRIGMPGDGRGTFEDLDRASDAMADTANHPMLVHCYAGANRTGAAFVAYRLRYCGWTFDRAMEEAERHGYSPSATPEMRDHLLSYWESRQPRGSAGTRPAETVSTGR